MKKLFAAAAPLLSLALCADAAVGAERHGHGGPAAMVVAPDNASLTWAPAPASLPKGMELVVVMGDPAKPGPFVLRVRMPPNTTIAPHTHPTPETLTVIEGSFSHDMGETLDTSRGQGVKTGGFVYLPAEMPHSLWNGGETTVLQVNGTGPFLLKYLNPKDDPSGQSK